MDLNLKVNSFITAAGTWNVVLLRELFVKEDIERIMSYPPVINMPDCWIWAHTKEWVYNVKSGNWLVSSLVSTDVFGQGNNTLIKQLKKRCWKIETEPKIHLFCGGSSLVH
ncbi:hypothetical protein V5N11_007217 [Cardamine amara subsp. amara]|uniref:Uncharacterized protein n=1 Tax=Cardamine amara subsp. amara TaxID=228776 RepID=A0ABD0ZZH0_CARAN